MAPEDRRLRTSLLATSDSMQNGQTYFLFYIPDFQTCFLFYIPDFTFCRALHLTHPELMISFSMSATTRILILSHMRTRFHQSMSTELP